jgi:hypothetical protein
LRADRLYFYRCDDQCGIEGTPGLIADLAVDLKAVPALEVAHGRIGLTAEHSIFIQRFLGTNVSGVELALMWYLPLEAPQCVDPPDDK